ncbi:hypothetical protein RchiOBHm_Chr1g0380241 [Rosa chinensis]|uniref:Uncharacterized protein n=1 Tax=Rosa chinensis TaxID=74649 RepID=A0A2P6SNY2_ROSCH|nr:hypothetical protein RchiOBHm_Chr1g0380241 [Rosa chinensis]
MHVTGGAQLGSEPSWHISVESFLDQIEVAASCSLSDISVSREVTCLQFHRVPSEIESTEYSQLLADDHSSLQVLKP